jgi:signal peptidase I
MSATASAESADSKSKKPGHPQDRTRETIETIVFVVVLVLLLKLFVTEAFVIPTGSMAETLYGYQKIITCPKCGHEFPVNSHDEVEGGANENNQGGPRRAVDMIGYTCPNCRFPGRFPPKADGRPDSPPNNTGDRVLVLKPIYHLKEPDRGDVVVFKYPQAPQERQVAQNYIKRAMAFGGETVAIHMGDIYVTRSLDYPADAVGPDGFPLFERPDDPLELWRPRYMYQNNQKAMDLFEKSKAAGFPTGQGGFEIVRKDVDHLLADRRIVWDNEKLPTELAGKFPPRWFPASGAKNWKGNNDQLPEVFTHTGDDLEWIRYRHLIYPWEEPGTAADTKPTFIDNMLGYNSEVGRYRDSGNPTPPRSSEAEKEWVGDLILECEAVMEGNSEVTLELSKGLNRFQATFGNGNVKLASTGPGAQEFGTRPSKVTSGTYKLRFANVDCRLLVWVDGKLIDFGTDADYLPGSTVPNEPNTSGYYKDNDIEAPASIGAKGTATIRGIKLHRDVFYTHGMGGAFLYYVQPGHYLCLGDNSAQSSDSRTWGTVPERLMLGKAVFVFWPFYFNPSKNRIGFIK